jgi:hypothetical protein
MKLAALMASSIFQGGNMIRTTALILMIVLAVAAPLAAFENPGLRTAVPDKNQLKVGPESLGGMILDKNVELMMRDGTYIKGRVLEADKRSITIKIKKCEPGNRIKGPEATLAAQDIGVVYYRQNGNVAPSVALGVLGGVLGGAGAGNVAYSSGSSSGGVMMSFVAGIVGGATGGSLLGREITRRTVTLNVVAPSAKSTAQAAVSGDPVSSR